MDDSKIVQEKKKKGWWERNLAYLCSLKESKALIVLVLALVGSFFVTSFFVVDFLVIRSPHTYRPMPQTRTAKGCPVYFLSSARISGNTLKIWSVKQDLITIVDPTFHLVVIVNPKYKGTALVVFRWTGRALNNVDAAQLFVRTQEQADIWEKALREALEKYEQSLHPHDVLPSG